MNTDLSLIRLQADVPVCEISEINFPALHPFDRMRVVMEQMFFAEFLINTTNAKHYGQYLAHLKNVVNTLPDHITEDNEAINSLYKEGMAGFDKDGSYNNTLSYQVLNAIFTEKPLTYSGCPYYTGSMNQIFLEEFAAAYLTKYDTINHPDGQLYNAAIFIPDEVLMKTRHSNNKLPYICTFLKSFRVTKFDATMNNSRDLVGYLSHFTMEAYTPEDLVGIMASFSLDHSRIRLHGTNYDMMPEQYMGKPCVSDICFDLVTGSTFAGASAGDKPVDYLAFVQMAETMITSGRLGNVGDYVLFGELLSKMGETSKTVNYFIKPGSLISASEAQAFRESQFAKFVRDKFSPGMAAIEDDATDEDTPDDETSEDTSLQEEGNVEATPTTEEDPSALGDSGDMMDNEESSNAERANPTLDPDMMLLELAQPSETMSDYIYREMVGKRISYILKNPPANARPNDLLMLKRWKSRWLYLASIACLRDFLARVSLRLTDAR